MRDKAGCHHCGADRIMNDVAVLFHVMFSALQLVLYEVLPTRVSHIVICAHLPGIRGRIISVL